MDSLAGAVGAASTGLSGIAGDIVALVKSPIAMLIAAIGAVIALGVKMWDKLTVSQEEHKQKLESTLKTLEELRSAYQKQAETTDNLFERLLELNSIFPKTNSVLEEQKNIINSLNDSYKLLQVGLNDTGDDFEKLLRKMKQKNVEDYHAATSASQNIIKNLKEQISIGLEDLDLGFLESLNNLGELQKQILQNTRWTFDYIDMSLPTNDLKLHRPDEERGGKRLEF